MNRKDYVGSLAIKGQLVNVGMDDYGQCYYFEYYDKDENKILERSCGAYNDLFIDDIVYFFDYKGYSISVYGEEEWEEQTQRLINRWIDKGWAKETPEQFIEMVELRNSEDYEVYDIDEMYRQFNRQNN